MNFSVENILGMISSYGEEGLQSDLAAFDCPQNIEIETFIRNKAIDFAKRKLMIHKRNTAQVADSHQRCKESKYQLSETKHG